MPEVPPGKNALNHPWPRHHDTSRLKKTSLYDCATEVPISQLSSLGPKWTPQKNLQKNWKVFCSHYYFHQLLWRLFAVVLIPQNKFSQKFITSVKKAIYFAFTKCWKNTTEKSRQLTKIWNLLQGPLNGIVLTTWFSPLCALQINPLSPQRIRKFNFLTTLGNYV